MKYYSTRNSKNEVSASEAISIGISPDGGLFVPEMFPSLSLDTIKSMCKMTYQEKASIILGKYLTEYSESEINDLVSKAYGENFDCKEITPLKFINNKTAVLELWHGPTCAFKDLALQLLPHLLTSSLKKRNEDREVCILVATSGDTGKAALEGFADVEGTKIIVFYPKDGVSDVQQLQMLSQTGNNVMVSAVEGNFDDAQTGVKTIFTDELFKSEMSNKGYLLSSANSINWGRLLPQIVYYFSAYCDYVNSGNINFGDMIDFAVPTGNFGDILAGWYAKKMGLPVNKLICCSNANNVLTDFIKTGIYNKNRKFITTISPSMDILVSSNLERLLYSLTGSDAEVKSLMQNLSEYGEYKVNDNILKLLKNDFDAGCCNDSDTKVTIKNIYDKHNYLIDTHTAVAFNVVETYRSETNSNCPTVILSTASPYKFSNSVLSALGYNEHLNGVKLITKLEEITSVKMPMPIKKLLDAKARFNCVISKDKMKDTVRNFLI